MVVYLRKLINLAKVIWFKLEEVIQIILKMMNICKTIRWRLLGIFWSIMEHLKDYLEFLHHKTNLALLI